MPSPFPHEYKVELKSIDGTIAALKGGEEPELRGAPPIHFDGPGGTWSPETLLLGAIELCYFTTLTALNKRKNIRFSDFSSEIRGQLEKGAQGIVFTRIELDVNLSAPAEDHTKLIELLQSAKKHCIISNAVKTEVKLNINLSARTT